MSFAAQQNKPHTTVTDARHADEPSLIIYSNRPPTTSLTGGAVRVIAASKPAIWLGPGETVSDKEWNAMSEEERNELTEHRVKGLEGTKVFTFKVPKYLQEAQYNEIANGLLWPIMHSMDPQMFFDPTHPRNSKEADTFVFDKMTVEQAETAYQQYKEFNNLANAAMKQLEDRGLKSDKDTVWVHDYQCVNVKGDIFSRHIPFPPVEYLEKVRIGNTPLLETDFFKDYVQQLLSHDTISFQRSVDMQNFLETLEILDPAFKESNKDNGKIYQNGTITVSDTIGKDSALTFKAFGKEASHILTVPVGISQEENLAEAIENESKMDKTHIPYDVLAKAGIYLYDKCDLKDRPKDDEHEAASDIIPIFVSNGEDEKESLSSTATNAENTITMKELVGDILDTIKNPETRVFASFHRNDYTKSTMEKLEAIEQFFEAHPEELGKTHFVFGLEPTRSNVPGYKEYQDGVLNYTKELREKFGEHADSLIVIPSSIDHGDIMGFLRHDAVFGFIGAGLKDGHDLTVREAVDAKADKRYDYVAIITTNGVGASDIYRGKADKPNAYILDSSLDRQQFVKEMADSIADVVQKSRDPDKSAELKQRYEVLKKASAHYSADNFVQTIESAHEDMAKFRETTERGTGTARAV